MKTWKAVEELSNSSVVQCNCGKIHNINNSKLDMFTCDSDFHTVLDKDEFNYLKLYMKNAKEANRTFEISAYCFKHVINSNCFYCGSSPTYKKSIDRNFNGIDRFDNTKPYDESNMVACCSICNKMKSNTDIKEFLTHCEKIVNNKAKYENINKFSEEMLYYIDRGWLIDPIKVCKLVHRGLLSLDSFSFDYIKYIESRPRDEFVIKYTDASYSFKRGKIMKKTKMEKNIKSDMLNFFRGEHYSDIFKNLIQDNSDDKVLYTPRIGK